MSLNISKLKTNTVGLLKSTFFFKPIVIKPGILYRLKYAFTILISYFIFYYLISLWLISLETKKLALNILVLPVYTFVFLVSAFFYKKIQRGPYHFNKYFVITLVSNLYLPICNSLFLFRNFFVVFFAFFVNLVVGSFLCYINMSFLTFWEGSHLLRGYGVILGNNLFINGTVLFFVKFLKLK